MAVSVNHAVCVNQGLSVNHIKDVIHSSGVNQWGSETQIPKRE